MRASVVVVARDAEERIERCLASLAWTDERIVVVDDRTRDATAERARGAGARVLHHRFEGLVEQKRFALSQAGGDWVVALDADEALSPGLAAGLPAALARADPRVDGFELDRVTWHLGRWIRHGDFHPDWQLRVIRRGRGDWEGPNPHPRLRVAGAVQRLPGDLEHWSYADLADQVARIQEFSAVEAASLRAAGRRAGLVALLLRPPARFLRAYLLKGGYRDGVPGLVIATATAFHVFLKYAKLWESQNVQSPERVS